MDLTVSPLVVSVSARAAPEALLTRTLSAAALSQEMAAQDKLSPVHITSLADATRIPVAYFHVTPCALAAVYCGTGASWKARVSAGWHGAG